MLQWKWIMCSYINHSRLNYQHNSEGLCDYLKRMRIFTLTSFKFWNLKWKPAWFVAFAIQMRQFPSQFKAKIGCGVGSAHNKATLAICKGKANLRRRWSCYFCKHEEVQGLQQALNVSMEGVLHPARCEDNVGRLVHAQSVQSSSLSNE